jgi:hypothetical protein
VLLKEILRIFVRTTRTSVNVLFSIANSLHIAVNKYMQSNPVFTPPIAVLDDYRTAGQFKIQNGQLVQLISALGDEPELLYATVANKTTHNGRTRAVTFSSKMGGYEAFDLEGTAVVWTDVSDERSSNASAWWICEGNQLFINLGDYMSGTDKGCVDQKVSYVKNVFEVRN